MKSFISLSAALCLLLLLACPTDVQAGGQIIVSEKEFFYGKDPSKNIKKWIRLVLLTPRPSVPPIIFFSPQRFELHAPQRLIHLSTRQYRSFVKYSRGYRCEATLGVYIPSEILEATEYSSGSSQVLCRMSFAEACKYLNGIRAISGINWRDEKWQIVKSVGNRLNC